MENGYKILWTDHALTELSKTIEYLELNWTDKDVKNFVNKLYNTLRLIATNPEIFPISESKKLRRAIVTKHNTLYYREKNNSIEIMSFFSHRQNPRKRKL